jgi:hypothetical protein
MKYLCQLESKVGNNCDLLTPFTIIPLEEKINDVFVSSSYLSFKSKISGLL